MTKLFLNFIKNQDKDIKQLAEKFSKYRNLENKEITYREAKKRIVDWLSNFDNVGFKDFEILLEFFKKIDFISSDNIQNKLIEIAKDHLNENCYIAPLGEINESSFRLSTIFHRYKNFKTNISDLLNIIPEDTKEKILLFDDFLNSGGQIVTIFYSLLGLKIPLGETNDEGDYRECLNNFQIKKLKKCEIHLFYYKAFDEGIERLERRLINEIGLTIKIHRHTPANANNGVFGDLDDQAKIEDGLSGEVKTECTFQNVSYIRLTDIYSVLKNIGELLLRVNKPDWDEFKYKERALGYGNLCRLIITDSNIPTISITALWLGGDIKYKGRRIFWKELLKRREKKITKKNNQLSVIHAKHNSCEITTEDLHKFIVNNYLKSNLNYNLTNYDELIEYHSNYFKHIINIKPAFNGPLNFDLDANIFKQLMDYIINCKSDNPLLVDGFAGCGKSSFLSLLYISFYKLYFEKKIDKLPVFINLHKYNKEIYNTSESFQKQAISKLNLDLKILDEIIDSENDTKLIIIIDGADEYINLKVDLEDYLFQKLQNLKVSTKIIGLRKHKEENTKSYKKNKAIPFLQDQETEIELIKKNVSDNDFEIFVENFSKSEIYNHNKSFDEIAKYLKETIFKFKIEEVDIFIMTILLNGLKNRNFNECMTLSSFYYKYFETKNIDIIKSAQIAFQLYNAPSLTSDKEKNNIFWWKIQKHESFRDFLVAYHIYIQLSENKEKDKKLEIFNHVYPYNINNFCKEIINSRVENQKKCFYTIAKIMKELSITAQTHFCYLLGRFVNPTVKSNAIKFLNEIKRKVESSLDEYQLKGASNPLTQEDKRNLLFLRTIYISLTYLGDKEASKKYIDHLLNNNYFDNLNRGFHLEYYEDIIFDHSDPSILKNEDNLEDFPKTFNRLNSRLRKALESKKYYPMFLIELYTITSLAQHRQILKKLDPYKKVNIVELIKKTLETFDFDDSNSRLYKYLSFINSNFENYPTLKLGTFILELYRLKELKRSGWVIETRNIPEPETVASHMYGAFILAYFHLPEYKKPDPTCNHDSVYNKDKILKLLLTHDIAEAYTGDLLPHEKTKQKMKEEEKHFDNLSLIGTYDGISNVSELEDLYKEFQHSETINGKIAREIDKLENLIQLFIYNVKFPNKIIDFEKFKNDLVSNIRTEEGTKIKNIIIQLFENNIN